jgi:hypothetical protein
VSPLGRLYYPLALEDEEGKKKETRWIAVINQTKRRRRGLGDWK